MIDAGRRVLGVGRLDLPAQCLGDVLQPRRIGPELIEKLAISLAGPAIPRLVDHAQSVAGLIAQVRCRKA